MATHEHVGVSVNIIPCTPNEALHVLEVLNRVTVGLTMEGYALSINVFPLECEHEHSDDQKE